MKLFLTGGFLGSGKTTAIKNACSVLMKNGVKVAVITNDQGADLVDTGFIKSFGIPAMEVLGGCFCCNYEKLAGSISTLHETQQPEVIFAESVGSCTDLVATISKPLAKFNPEIKVVISVFADASLLFSLISGTSSFVNDHVRYIYKKQLEEADILIINKIDLLKEDELEIVRQLIMKDYPDKMVLNQNSLEQHHVEQWLISMEEFRLHKHRKSLKLDYDVYAKGEAMLAWLDEELEIYTTDYTANEVAIKLINNIESTIREQQYLIGHLKFLVNDGETKQKISYTATIVEKQSLSCYSKTNKVSLLINARVQAEPSSLKEIISNVIDAITAQTNSQILVNSLSAFKPGYPKPAYRIAD